VTRDTAPRNLVLERALAYAAYGWPVFPCQPGRKVPACAHGYLDATTDPRKITAWFARRPDHNLAIATGLPGPDVLDVDRHPTGNGFAALSRLRQAGLTDGAAAWIRTPSGGVHAYFTGSDQHCGHLPARHLDFRSAGGYVLAPPSQVRGQAYRLIAAPGGRTGLDWQQAVTLLEPARYHQYATAAQADVGRLTAWLARLEEGNRNAGLFWAANRALEAGDAASLGALADAARQAGLGYREITATLNSARRTARQHQPRSPQAQAEAEAEA